MFTLGSCAKEKKCKQQKFLSDRSKQGNELNWAKIIIKSFLSLFFHFEASKSNDYNNSLINHLKYVHKILVILHYYYNSIIVLLLRV